MKIKLIFLHIYIFQISELKPIFQKKIQYGNKNYYLVVKINEKNVYCNFLFFSYEKRL